MVPLIPMVLLQDSLGVSGFVNLQSDGRTDGSGLQQVPFYMVKERYMGPFCKAKFLETEGLSVL